MYDQLDDAELLLLSVRRPDAFAGLYRRHAEALLAFFVRRTFDPEAAADLTAETFAQAFVSRTKFRPQGVDGGAWLYGIARHQLSRFRRRGVVAARARSRLGIPSREISPEDYERIEELIDFDSIRSVIGEAFEALSDDQRRAMELRVVEGRSYEEVARVLECSEEAARARVSRGLRKLTKLLEPRRVEMEAKVVLA